MDNIRVRFEIELLKSTSHILNIFVLRGDFETGDIRHVSYEFSNFEELKAVLNTSMKEVFFPFVNELLGEK